MKVDTDFWVSTWNNRNLFYCQANGLYYLGTKSPITFKTIFNYKSQSQLIRLALPNTGVQCI